MGSVSGEDAAKMALLCYDKGRETAMAEPQRIRLQAAAGVPVDVTVAGEITPTVLRNIARLLIANAEVLEDQPPSPPEQPATSPASTYLGTPAAEPQSGERTKPSENTHAE